jgi:hypothetical protein
MYFVNEYREDGSLPHGEKLEEIVTRAEGSSLDQIAWGLVYPDLARTLNPIPVPFSAFTLDRGQALERAWLREDMQHMKWNQQGIGEGLSQWAAKANQGTRPGVIFNTTIAETGDRLPLSTVKLPQKSPGGIRYRQLFEDLEPQPTIPVVTAARLSATFPYVSPAARAKIPPQARKDEDGNRYYEDHLVDGGYYDNYGISSLVEWLDWKLAHDHKHEIRRVLVIQIIASPSADEQDPKGSLLKRLSERLDQILYQAAAPAETVLNVRRAGQRTHSEVELKLLEEKWGKGNPCVAITRVAFKPPPVRSCLCPGI